VRPPCKVLPTSRPIVSSLNIWSSSSTETSLEREEVVRPYDGKTVVWEKRLMPDLVENYKRIRRKEYCDPYFWVITEVKGNKNV